LAKSSDGQRLFVGTEKGEIIIWNIKLQRVERRLQQPSPVHLVATLSDPHYIIASGSNHHEPLRPLVRKWNIETGAFIDLQGLDQASFPTALAADAQLITLGSADGTVLVWDWSSEKMVANWKLKEVPISLAFSKQSLYVVSINRASIASDDMTAQNAIIKLSIDDPKKESIEFLKAPAGAWTALAASPDGRLLSATYNSPGEGERTVVVDPQLKSQLGSFSASASVWISSTNLLLFNWLDPSELVQITNNGKAVSVKKFERMEADTPGRAFDLTGQVSSSNASKIWAAYRKGPGLLEFDSASRKIKTLIGGPSGAYGVSVLTQDSQDGLLLTGGADGYVRLWKLSDISLIREYPIAPPDHFVASVHLVPGQQQAVVSVMRIRKESEPPSTNEVSEVSLLNLETGEHRKLLDVRWWRADITLVGTQLMYPEIDRIKLATLESNRPIREFIAKAPIVRSAVSANGRWLAILDSGQTLSVFETATGKQTAIKATNADEWGPLVVTIDGRYVYQVASEGQVTRWDMQTGKVNESVLAKIREMHTRADFITLANDDQWLITGGNHGDVGIFDRTTGSLVSYTQTSAAGFYVEKVWVSGSRMIVTTDTGVMFEGILTK
jgi:WD40 repeat protein